MDEQRKFVVLIAATILAARKLNESESTPWPIHVAITDAIEKASRILEKIDKRWPSTNSDHTKEKLLPSE